MNGPLPVMAMNPSAGGPVGAPSADLSQMQQPDLNTYIYDYLLRRRHWELARVFVKQVPCKTVAKSKHNGPMDMKKDDRPDDLQDPDIPGVAPDDQAFLESWWQCFWDMFFTACSPKIALQNPLHKEYLMQQRQRSSAGNAAMMGANRGVNQFNMVNGVMGKQMQNRNVTPQTIAGMHGKMMGQQMQRDASNMDINGQRPQTPGDNAPSPTKRQRLDNGSFDAQAMANRQVSGNQQLGAMGANGAQGLMPNGQMAAFGPGGAQMKMENMNGMAQAPMNQGVEGGGDNRHALQDYQMQLMLLEQQNKKRLLQANRDRDTIVGTNPNGGPGNGFTAPNMSPSASRGGGPSPTPGDMKRFVGTPKMAQQGIPGSPMPDMQNRASPAPSLDPNTTQLPPGAMPQQFYTPMSGPMARQAPSSHPNYGMNMQINQIDPMQRMAAGGRMPNGQQWPPPQAMQAAQQNPALRNPQQGAMGPPPAPAEPQATQQRTQPSSPAQPPAPPTPSTGNKANPKSKKETAATKKKNLTKKGSTAGATPAAENVEPPISTPSTPITPMPPNTTFNKPAQQTASVNTSHPPPAPTTQQPLVDANPAQNGFPSLADDYNSANLDFASVDTNDVLENFDFDSFLHTDDVNSINFPTDSFDINGLTDAPV